MALRKARDVSEKKGRKGSRCVGEGVVDRLLGYVKMYAFEACLEKSDIKPHLLHNTHR